MVFIMSGVYITHILTLYNPTLIFTFPFALECAGIINWIGDGYCDDVNNNKECDYDGNDCCGLFINTEHCTFCQCHLDHGKYETTSFARVVTFTKKFNTVFFIHTV